MLQAQTQLSVKDNSKFLKIKIINIYSKKNIKFNNYFLAVIKSSKNPDIKSGSMLRFLATHTKKKLISFNGRSKKSDLNFCITIKDKKKNRASFN